MLRQLLMETKRGVPQPSLLKLAWFLARNSSPMPASDCPPVQECDAKFDAAAADPAGAAQQLGSLKV